MTGHFGEQSILDKAAASAELPRHVMPIPILTVCDVQVLQQKMDTLGSW